METVVTNMGALDANAQGSGDAERWFVPAPSARARGRLYCFPYAGADPWTFRRWFNRMPVGTEVCAIQLPGRWGRLHERPFDTVAPLVAALGEALRSAPDVPFAFFGYSMGGLIAFELARHCRRLGWPQPRQMFVAASRAPQRTSTREPVCGLSEREFIRVVAERYRSIPEAVLQDEELRAFTVRVMRADLSLVETYRYQSEAPLSVPIVAFGGSGDPLVSLRDVEAWREQTQGGFESCIYSAGHFFLESLHGRLVDRVGEGVRTLW